MLKRWIGRGLLVGLWTAGLAWAQTPSAVQELQSAELPDYLQRHPKVLVLFNSPDPKCGFCVGADVSYEQAVRQIAAPDWRFVKVQWTPWRDFPPEVLAQGLGGVPAHMAYVGGKLVGRAEGREKNVEHLRKGLVAAMSGEKWQPLAASRPRPQPLPRPRPREETEKAFNPQNWLRPMEPGWAEVQGRRTYLLGLRNRCLERHPDSDQALRPLVNDWARKALPIIFDMSQVGWLERDEGKQAVAAQEARFEQAMREQAGLSPKEPLDAADCERLMKLATAVPLPHVPPPPERVPDNPLKGQRTP